MRVQERPALQGSLPGSRSTTFAARRRAVRELVAVRAQPLQLPPARRGRGRGYRRRAARQGAARARLRVRPSPGRAPMDVALEASASMGASRRRLSLRLSEAPRDAANRDGRASRRRPGARLPRRALPARHVRRLRSPLRHLRDRDHLGPLRRLPRRGDRTPRHRSPRSRRRRDGRPVLVLPLHPRLSGRPGPYFTVLAPGPSRAARSSSGTRSRRPSRRR